jgi:hypothetical protein
MCKTQLFSHVLSLVSKETEIPELMILSNSKIVPVVDARSILVNILVEQGLYPNQIAEYLHKTPASIRNLHNNFVNRQRSNKIIANYAQNVRKSLET